MSRKRCLNYLKVILLPLIAFVFLLCLPIAAEEKSSKVNPVPDREKKTEDKINGIYLTPIKSNSFINLELFSLINGKNINLKSEFNLTPKKIVLNPDSYKYLSKKIKSDRLENSLYTTSLITLTALNVADYFSTIKALKYEGLKEGNPLMKPFSENILLFTTVKLGLAVSNYYILKQIHKKNKRVAWVISTISNFAMAYIVANNFRMIHKAQGKM